MKKYLFFFTLIPFFTLAQIIYNPQDLYDNPEDLLESPKDL